MSSIWLLAVAAQGLLVVEGLEDIVLP